MSYTCPVCNYCLFKYKYASCRHTVGKYLVFVYWDTEVRIYIQANYSDKNSRITLNSPKRLDEEYIDKMMLLK